MSKIHSVCVYCGHSNGVDGVFAATADYMGKCIAENGFRLVYGGGRMGLMGVVADAAIRHGGRVLGFIPQHLEAYEGAHTGIQELHIVDSMHTRKAKMAENADAFVILPGGFGTLDELFEMITWRQLELHNKQIIVVNIDGYWDPLVQLMQNMVNKNFAASKDIGYIQVVKTVDEAMIILQNIEGGIQRCDTQIV